MLYRWVDLDRPLWKQLQKYAQEFRLYFAVMFHSPLVEVFQITDEETRFFTIFLHFFLLFFTIFLLFFTIFYSFLFNFTIFYNFFYFSVFFTIFFTIFHFFILSLFIF